ncbi:MAG: ribosomal L7Ae/L30e/S12e/Gadd45 family protein [Lachnospiraceae bacterium]|nr:ribosomal L7Ae/L30e/S12e/Gadd45 family protein [Lachnospiraceae bacterium]
MQSDEKKVNDRKIYNLLGLMTKSRKLVSGSFMAERAVKDGSARLVIVSEDASDNTKKLFRNKCEFYQVPYYIFGNSENIGQAMGKEARVTLAVTDNGFAGSLKKLLD